MGLIRSHKEKEQVFSQLSEKVKRYDEEAKRKCEEREHYNGVSSSLQKTRELDGIYLKSIKAKLACLEMKM